MLRAARSASAVSSPNTIQLEDRVLLSASPGPVVANDATVRTAGVSDLLAPTSTDIKQAAAASANGASVDGLRTAADGLALLDSLIDGVLAASGQAEGACNRLGEDSLIADVDRSIGDLTRVTEAGNIEAGVVVTETSLPQGQELIEPFALEGTSGERADVTLRRELVIIDPGVQNFESLRDLLSGQQEVSRAIELVVLDADRDGAQQIADILAGHDDLDAVHILSHGTAQGLQLGSTWLDAQTIENSHATRSTGGRVRSVTRGTCCSMLAIWPPVTKVVHCWPPLDGGRPRMSRPAPI